LPPPVKLFFGNYISLVTCFENQLGLALFGSDRMQDMDTLQNKRSARVRRLQVSRLGFVLLVATVLSFINAGSVLQRTSSFSRTSPGIFALQTVTEVALLWCTMAALVLPAAFNNRILKVWTLLLVGLRFISSYYVVRLNVGIDMSVIRSILSTDQKEVVEFIDPLSLLLLVAVVGTTTAVLAITRIVPRYQVTGKVVLAPRLIGVLFLTSAIFLGVLSSHQAFEIDTRFFKSGLPRYSPLNLLVYGAKYGRHAWRTRQVIVQDISPQFTLADTAPATAKSSLLCLAKVHDPPISRWLVTIGQPIRVCRASLI
jgi:glucan phosphoethanolaminetransferase (alkaline phosphatase superfamily)